MMMMELLYSEAGDVLVDFAVTIDEFSLLMESGVTASRCQPASAGFAAVCGGAIISDEMCTADASVLSRQVPGHLTIALGCLQSLWQPHQQRRRCQDVMLMQK